MSFLSLDKIPTVYSEFVTTKLIPVAPNLTKFFLGASIPLVANNYTQMINQYSKQAQAFGLLTDQKLDLSKLKECIMQGFSASKSLTLFNEITLNQIDAEALFAICEKYKDA